MSMQGTQAQQNIMNMTNNPIAMAVQLQAMQALALERNIDLSSPVNASMMAQPLLHSGMFAQQKVNESNPGIHLESVPKQSAGGFRCSGEEGEKSPLSGSGRDGGGVGEG
ncbi:ATP-dependent helicase BRM [Abeliophyllum distichum]|uniref:ATP-dependent helicase BRM n=1 Tax=Abeliophyllum distichum TaxID=126358 RepID=A0ABD1QNR2_9LAMI